MPTTSDLEAMNLNEAENLVLQCAREGRIADFKNKEVIRGEFLGLLASEENADWKVSPTGVVVIGATIHGVLDLVHRRVVKPLRLRMCSFDGGNMVAVSADGAEMEVLEISCSQLKGGFRAEYIKISKGLYLNGTRILGSMNLRGATVLGPVVANNMVIEAKDGEAVIGEIAQFKVVIFDGLVMRGMMSMADACIEAALSIIGANLDNGRDVVLDLSRVRVNVLALFKTSFMGITIMQSAKVGALFNATQASFKNPGGMALDATHLCADCIFMMAAVCEGEFSLIGAKVTNNVLLERSRFYNPGSLAIQADSLQAAQVNLGRSTVIGEVRLLYARVLAQLDFHDANIQCKGNLALTIDEAHVGSLILEGAQVDGGVRLRQIQISTSLRGTKVRINNPGHAALSMEYGCVDACLFGGAELNGYVRMVGARISSHLGLEELVINSPGTNAFEGWNMRMATICLDDSKIVGKVILANSRIEEKLLAYGLSIINRNSIALDMSGAVVNGPVSLLGRGVKTPAQATIEGGINLAYANLSGPVVFKEMNIQHTLAVAIDLTGCFIPGRFGCIDSRATGALLLDGSNIVRHCELKNVSFEYQKVPAAIESERPIAISIRDATIGRLTLPSGRQAGGVDLSRSTVGTLVDFSSGWEQGGDEKAHPILLSGLKYEYLEHPGGTGQGLIWRVRLGWLKSQPADFITEHFDPHPWRTLSAVLTKQGYEEDAKQILIQERIHNAAAKDASLGTRCMSRLLHSLGDYGFNPGKTLLWLVGLWIGCAMIYGFAVTQCEATTCVDGSMFVPVVVGDVAISDRSQSRVIAGPSIEEYPPFEPLSYSLDLMIPLLDLGAESYWRPNTQAGVIFGPFGDWLLLTGGGLLYLLVVFQEIAGSFIVAVAIAGFTGFLIRYRDA